MAWNAPLLGATMTSTYTLARTCESVVQTLNVKVTDRFSPLVVAVMRRPISVPIATENLGFTWAAECSKERSIPSTTSDPGPQ